MSKGGRGRHLVEAGLRLSKRLSKEFQVSRDPGAADAKRCQEGGCQVGRLKKMCRDKFGVTEILAASGSNAGKSTFPSFPAVPSSHKVTDSYTHASQSDRVEISII